MIPHSEGREYKPQLILLFISDYTWHYIPGQTGTTGHRSYQVCLKSVLGDHHFLPGLWSHCCCFYVLLVLYERTYNRAMLVERCSFSVTHFTHTAISALFLDAEFSGPGGVEGCLEAAVGPQVHW